MNVSYPQGSELRHMVLLNFLRAVPCRRKYSRRCFFIGTNNILKFIRIRTYTNGPARSLVPLTLGTDNNNDNDNPSVSSRNTIFIRLLVHASAAAWVDPARLLGQTGQSRPFSRLYTTVTSILWPLSTITHNSVLSIRY